MARHGQGSGDCHFGSRCRQPLASLMKSRPPDQARGRVDQKAEATLLIMPATDPKATDAAVQSAARALSAAELLKATFKATIWLLWESKGSTGSKGTVPVASRGH